MKPLKISPSKIDLIREMLLAMSQTTPQEVTRREYKAVAGIFEKEIVNVKAAGYGNRNIMAVVRAVIALKEVPNDPA